MVIRMVLEEEAKSDRKFVSIPVVGVQSLGINVSLSIIIIVVCIGLVKTVNGLHFTLQSRSAIINSSIGLRRRPDYGYYDQVGHRLDETILHLTIDSEAQKYERIISQQQQVVKLQYVREEEEKEVLTTTTRVSALHQSTDSSQEQLSITDITHKGEERRSKLIRFSRAFQRHAIYQQKGDTVLSLSPESIKDGTTSSGQLLDLDCSSFDLLESYEFLDEAMRDYPNAQLIHPILDDDRIMYDDDGDDHGKKQQIIAGCGVLPVGPIEKKNMTQNGKTSEFKYANHERYQQVIDLLTRKRKEMNRKIQRLSSTSKETTHSEENILPESIGLACTVSDAQSVIQRFPQICSYDIQDLEDRIRFMLETKKVVLPSTKGLKSVDYMKLMLKGQGCGFTISQATKAIQVVPQLLSMYHEDAQKPSVLYFYKMLPSDVANTARTELSRSLVGCDISDVYAFGYLHHIGVSWDNIRTLMDAFPALIYSDSEPQWDMYLHGPVRSELKQSSLIYLRKRLQINNSQLHAILKTHTRLSTYSLRNSHHTLNEIETRLGISSSELRRLILRMPSIIGMSVNSSDSSVSALDKRINFFLNEVDMTNYELKNSILKQPSLLQYSVEASLRPKLIFFKEELGITKISRVISRSPAAMGLSLQANIRPKCKAIMEKCDFSTDELAVMIETVPAILVLSLKRKIEPCFSFLCNTLQLSTTTELKQIILKTPRILLQSVETSLIPKVQMVQEGLLRESNGKGRNISDEKAAKLTAMIFVSNPSLLATTNSILKMRIEKYLSAHVTLADALKPRNAAEGGTKHNIVSRRRKSVLEIHNGSVIKAFPSVKDAAKELEVSTSSIYLACGKNKLLKGREFRYGDTWPAIDQEKSYIESIDREILPEQYSLKPFNLYDKGIDSGKATIVVFATGSLYPSDDINTARGTRCAGALAIKFPQIPFGKSTYLRDKFYSATKKSFGMIMPESEKDGSKIAEGLVLVGFPFLKPSRNRCDLYACHGALKVVLQLLKLAAMEKSMEKIDIDVDIYSDSSYAFKILNENEKIVQWGLSVDSISDFVNIYRNDGNCPTALANPDLLFPLCKTASRIVHQDVKDINGKNLCLGNNIRINFLHCSDILRDGSIHGLKERAKKTAMWQYKKC